MDPGSSDRIIGLALEEGLVSADLLEACGRSLSNLIERGHLSREQVERLHTTVVQRTRGSGTLEDVGFEHLPGEVQEIARDPRSHFGPEGAYGLPRFILRKKVGQGGMGAVYRAYQTDLRRDVALKFCSGDDPDNLPRFLREASAAAGLQHVNIAQTFEVGEWNGRHFISMQYVRGLPLNKVRLPPRAAAAVMEKVARAVHFAHSRGIIHRDIMPANIILSEPQVARRPQDPEVSGGNPFLLDFGLAKAVEQQGITMSGDIIGTPGYMPPEQAMGRHELIDVRTDVYSIGATLYHLVTGRSPFPLRGEQLSPIEILRQVVDQQPESPRALNPRVDRDLEVVMLKAMDKDGERRYATAEELAEQLRRYLDGEPIAGRSTITLRRVIWRAKKYRVALGLASLILLVGIAGGVLVWMTRTSGEEKLEAQQRHEEARSLVVSAQRFHQDRNHEAAVAATSRALELDPRNAEAWFWRGRAQARQYRERRPLPPTLILRGVVEFEPQGAETPEAEEARREAPASFEAFRQRADGRTLPWQAHMTEGILRFMNGEWKAADESFDRAGENEIARADWELTAYQAESKYMQEDFEGCEAVLERWNRRSGGLNDDLHLLRAQATLAVGLHRILVGGQEDDIIRDLNIAASAALMLSSGRQEHVMSEARILEVKARFALGRFLGSRGRTEAAGEIQRAMAALDRTPESVEVSVLKTEGHAELAIARQSRGEYEEAVGSVERSISALEAPCEQGSVMAQFVRAQVRTLHADLLARLRQSEESQKQLLLAMDDYSKVLDRGRERFKRFARLGFGEVRSRQPGGHAAGIERIDKAIEEDSQYAPAYLARATAHVIQAEDRLLPESDLVSRPKGDPTESCDRAYEDCTKAIEINPRYADAYVLRARSDRLRTQHLMVVSNDPEIEQALPTIDAWSSRAIEDLDAAVGINPNHAPALMDRGWIKAMRGYATQRCGRDGRADMEAGIEDLKAGLAINDRDLQGTLRLAELYSRLAEVHGSIAGWVDVYQAYGKAVEIHARDLNAVFGRAQTARILENRFRGAGRLDDARKFAEDAVKHYSEFIDLVDGSDGRAYVLRAEMHYLLAAHYEKLLTGRERADRAVAAMADWDTALNVPGFDVNEETLDGINEKRNWLKTQVLRADDF